MKVSTHQNKGFVALISIIIISVVLLATTLSLAQFGIANRFFILDLENKRASEKLAEACVHIARVSVYNNSAYEFNSTNARTVPIDTLTCTINSISRNNNESTVVVTAIQHNAITHYRVVIDNTNGSFLTWTELSAL